MNELLPKILFGAALLIGAFSYGMFSAERALFPYPTIKTARSTFTDLKKYWKNDLEIEPTRHLEQALRDGDGVTRRDPARMQPGWTFITGMFGDQMGARLIDEAGEVIHEWPVSYTTIWPEYPNHKGGEPVTDWNVFLHGSWLRPDGSIVINFDEGASLVKLDRCAGVVWKIYENIHHSVFEAEDGSFWAPVSDDIIQVSADGEILRRIDISDLMWRNGLEGALFIQAPKITNIHPNDVEVLSTAMAGAFPMFEAGDVIYSMRDLNLLIVFDPDTEVVKWYQHGPWLRQHDPDFLPDGRISVFNNRMEYDESNIMVIDPVSREVEVVYEGSDEEPFYTHIRGRHQTLENGNILITEAQQGRVFEVTPDRRIVWEYVNRYDADRVAVISDANRVPPEFFEVDDWTACANEAVIAKEEVP